MKKRFTVSFDKQTFSRIQSIRAKVIETGKSLPTSHVINQLVQEALTNIENHGTVLEGVEI